MMVMSAPCFEGRTHSSYIPHYRVVANLQSKPTTTKPINIYYKTYLKFHCIETIA